MEELDLNIDNYDYKDILNLFKISTSFGENELKKAKKHVLLMHPDKSGLDKKYFLFFTQAYKIIFSVYQFREKIDKGNDLPKENIEYLAEEDIYNREIIDSLKKNNRFNKDNFNKWFNEQFEKINIKNEYDGYGYGDWLKSIDDTDKLNDKCNNIKDMENKINKYKKEVRENTLQKYNGINEFNSRSYCDLTNSRPEEYSSDIFSSLQYEDLRKAHEESVIPVTEDDFKLNNESLEKVKLERSHHVGPLSERESQEYLNNQKGKDNIISSMRAFKLIKQERESEILNKNWWASLKQLK